MVSILIIDDDSEAREILCDILGEEGFRTASAGTGAKGVECLKKEAFDAVLLDLKLPDKEGLDILKDIVEFDPDQRVIAITGYATLDNAIKALNRGAFAYITKPFNIEEVIAIIKRAIQHSAMIAKKKQAEEEVRRLKEYTENILTSLPYGIVIFDQSRKIEYVNPIFLRDFNLHKKEEVLGKDLFEALPLPDPQKEKIKGDLESFLLGEAVEPREIEVDQRVFGSRLFYVLKGTIEKQTIGLIIGDISLEKKLQQQLIQSEKLAGIGTMAMGIAHEINNPLFAIMGLAETILDEKDPNFIKEYATEIVTYSSAASTIVRGLSIYSRSTGIRDIESVDVNEKLSDALKIAMHSVHFDGVQVVTDYKADKNIKINSGELQQVFVNIINNAVQAMDGKGRLLLSTRTNGQSVIARISDTGPGISKEHMGKIFDPFFTTKEPGKGTGLGLNIVYRIVTKHDGLINVESEEGKGATFVITFPIGE